MKYETPELTALSAINAIQTSSTPKNSSGGGDGSQPFPNEHSGVYVDWE